MKHCLLKLRRYMAFALCMVILSSFLCVPVSADEEALGWIEVKTEYPEELSRMVVLTLMNKETEEELDFLVLYENDYVLRQQVPVGEYSVSDVFVTEDFRYETTADVSEIEVKESVAAPINLTVAMRPEYLEEGSEEEPEVTEPDSELVVMPSETPVEEEGSETPSEEGEELVVMPAPEEPAEQPEEPEESVNLFERFTTVILGTGIFVAIVFGIIYFARKYMFSED